MRAAAGLSGHEIVDDAVEDVRFFQVGGVTAARQHDEAAGGDGELAQQCGSRAARGQGRADRLRHRIAGVRLNAEAIPSVGSDHLPLLIIADHSP
jgi:hypothetical protein